MRNESHVIYNTSHTTTTSYSSVHLPKHFSLCEQMGWALRNHKPPRRIEKLVKDYIEKICQEEKTYGRKIPPEEYVRRIRSARNSNGSKMFSPSQYLTTSPVRQMHIEIFNTAR